MLWSLSKVELEIKTMKESGLWTGNRKFLGGVWWRIGRGYLNESMMVLKTSFDGRI